MKVTRTLFSSPGHLFRTLSKSGFLFLTLLISLAVPASLDGMQPEPSEGAIRALVEDKIDSDGPGAAILVSRNGVPLHMAGYGMADVKARLPVTADSLFNLASVSKHLTGVAILTLMEKQKLKLEQPVAEYVQDFRVPRKGRAVTVADLLHHVSGLADYTRDDWEGSDEEFASLTSEAHLKWLNGTRPRRAPGVKYEYNNSEYALLALIVERLSGQSFAEYVRDHLFQPAGMEHTVVLDGKTKLPGTTVKGYETSKNGKVKRSSSPTVITGDGSVYTSIRELSLWDKALRNQTIITRRSQELAWTNGRYDNGKEIKTGDGDGYGLGWVVEKEGRIVSHSGSWAGTATHLLLDLEKGFTVAVLSNDGNLDTSDLAEEILALLRATGRESLRARPKPHPHSGTSGNTDRAARFPGSSEPHPGRRRA
jgi:CubicO group peptidase (beta-lactamase class C family)